MAYCLTLGCELDDLMPVYVPVPLRRVICSIWKSIELNLFLVLGKK